MKAGLGINREWTERFLPREEGKAAAGLFQDLQMVLSSQSALQDASETLTHVTAIASFLRQHEWLWRAHVVEFFQGKLWERVDEQWLTCLRCASMEDLLLLPSGFVQEEWPYSLKEFVQTASRLSLSRSVPSANSANLSSSGVAQAPIGSVLAQGMSVKKLHEIGILAALIARTAECIDSKHIIDVGAGQGYLALVLAFEYQLAVMAVDACAHHAEVTNKRALHIQKYYNARLRKARQDGLTHSVVCAPQTVTCRLGSGECPTALSSLLPAAVQATKVSEDPTMATKDMSTQSVKEGNRHNIVLAGLHACGDLSATMLQTFVESKEVAAVINVGCCYNLLSEDFSNVPNESYGFPLSQGVGHLGLQLGRSARDLACQSAERWKEHHPERACQNFESHCFRAAFQLILQRFYPEIAGRSPSLGRVGKSRRRRQARKVAMLPSNKSITLEDLPNNSQRELQDVDPVTCNGAHQKVVGDEALDSPEKVGLLNMCDSLEMPIILSAGDNSGKQGPLSGTLCLPGCEVDSQEPVEDVQYGNLGLASRSTISLREQGVKFEEYASSALERLNLPPLPAYELRSVWEEVAPQEDLVGPFWSLRAVLAPVIESYILLDRLLYLKEQAELVGVNSANSVGMTVELVPLFDPSISPRNMAIIAHRDRR